MPVGTPAGNAGPAKDHVEAKTTISTPGLNLKVDSLIDQSEDDLAQLATNILSPRYLLTSPRTLAQGAYGLVSRALFGADQDGADTATGKDKASSSPAAVQAGPGAGAGAGPFIINSPSSSETKDDLSSTGAVEAAADKAEDEAVLEVPPLMDTSVVVPNSGTASLNAAFGGTPADSKAMANEVDEETTMETCVCGKIHGPSRSAYWIFCDICRSWYHVQPTCVGFDQKAAEDVEWKCPSCDAA